VGPAALAVYGAMLATYTSEATMGLQEPVALLVSVWVLAWIYRRVRVGGAPAAAAAPSGPLLAGPAPA
jgi:hypothetical protein